MQVKHEKILVLLTIWLGSFALLSIGFVRSLLLAPLYVSDGSSTADVAYVMADGHAYWERLHGASDLYHMRRVSRIVISDEQTPAKYNFVKKKSDRLVDRAIDYLVWNGVPAEAISTVPVERDALFSSFGEARMVAENLSEVASITVVTSAPHTRRSLLCFQRVMPESIAVSVFAPTGPSDSAEIDAPIWLEYVKLAIYSLFAW